MKILKKRIVLIVLALVVGSLVFSFLLKSQGYNHREPKAATPIELETQPYESKEQNNALEKSVEASENTDVQESTPPQPQDSETMPASQKTQLEPVPPQSNVTEESPVEPVDVVISELDSAPQTIQKLTSGLSPTSSYDYVNKLRIGNNLPGLQSSDLLTQSAIKYADHLAQGCLSLVHSDISVLLGQLIDDKPINRSGENLAYNQTVDAALVALKNSPGHYANMVGNFSHIGIGVVQSKSPACAGRIYIVMQFGLI